MLDGDCLVRYDNERDKGDHRHLGGKEEAYSFTTLNNLRIDFEREVRQWNQGEQTMSRDFKVSVNSMDDFFSEVGDVLLNADLGTLPEKPVERVCVT